MLALVIFSSSMGADEALLRDELSGKAECLAYQAECKASPQNAPVISTALNLALVNCRTIHQSPTCQEYFKSDPYLAEHARPCDAENYCKDQLASGFDSLAACGLGFLEGTGEVITQISEAISKWAANVKTRVEERDEFIRLCNQSLDCKRDLVQGIGKFDAMTDSELSKYPAAALWVERENYSYIQATIKRQEHRTPQQSERLRLEVPKRMVEANRQSLLFAAIQWLHEKNVRLSCLDSQARAEMICWGAAYVIDPLLVAGAAAKGVKAAIYLRSLQGGGAGTVVANVPAKIPSGEVAGKVRDFAGGATETAQVTTQDVANRVGEAVGEAVEKGKPVDRANRFAPPMRPLRKDLRLAATKSEVVEIARELKRSDIPFCSITDGCDVRAHRVAMALEDKGIDSQKIFAVPENNQLYFSFDRSGLMVNDIHSVWRYHVANLVRVRTESGAMVDYVLDLSLFPGPVERQVWEERMRTAGGLMDFRRSEKTALRPARAYDPPSIWHPDDLEETTRTIRQMSANDLRYKGRQTLLKGRWIDRLKSGNPEPPRHGHMNIGPTMVQSPFILVLKKTGSKNL